MNIPGENSINILSSNEYLTRVNLMDAASEDSDTPVPFGKCVAVIGGGNTAMDSVRTARRLGAARALIIYRRSEEEMPARIEEVKHAKEEGVEFLTLHNPIEYIADEQGKVKQVPVRHYPRIAEKSKYNLCNRLISPFKDCFAYRWMKKRYINYEIADTHL